MSMYWVPFFILGLGTVLAVFLEISIWRARKLGLPPFDKEERQEMRCPNCGHEFGELKVKIVQYGASGGGGGGAVNADGSPYHPPKRRWWQLWKWL